MSSAAVAITSAALFSFASVNVASDVTGDPTEYERVHEVTFEAESKTAARRGIDRRLLFIKTDPTRHSGYDVLSDGRVYACIEKDGVIQCHFFPGATIEFLAGFDYVRLISGQSASTMPPPPLPDTLTLLPDTLTPIIIPADDVGRNHRLPELDEDDVVRIHGWDDELS